MDPECECERLRPLSVRRFIDSVTLVLESTFANLAEFEKGHTSTAMTDEWRAWYRKFTELVVTGRGEISTIVHWICKEPARAGSC